MRQKVNCFVCKNEIDQSGCLEPIFYRGVNWHYRCYEDQK